MSAKSVSYAFALLLLSCGCNSRRSRPGPAPVARAQASVDAQVKPAALPLASPTLLASLPISAYATSLALDEDAVYLLTSHAAYRLVKGEPMHGIRLELGIGATLTQSAFIFWSQGSIWRAPKQGGVARELAKFPHQPQYFVASGEAFAWLDQSEAGLYTIQTLVANQPKVLVSSTGEIRALNMIGDAVYFAQRPSDTSWRFGVVRLSGGGVEYATERKGRVPAQLAGVDALYYYDLDQSKILKRSLDFRSERVELDNFVCSPLSVSSSIFCGCVEGLFQVSKDAHKPTVLVSNPPGTISSIISNSKLVAWTVDVGQDHLAVDMLPLQETGAH